MNSNVIHERRKIVHGDCLKIMQRIPSDSVDISFADPPFNLNKKYASYRDQREFDDYLQWCRQWIHEMVRITKPSGSIFVHNIPKWLAFYTEFLHEVAEFRHWIAWDAPTAPMGKTLQPSHYGILYFAKNRSTNKFYEIRSPHRRCRKCGYLLKDYGGKKAKLHPFGPLISDVWTDIHRLRHNKRRDPHPCQLPVHLLERLILMSTDVDDLVFDPFIGTGTTAVAATRLGRRVVGIDIDKKYVDITRDKLKQEHLTSKIGNAWVSFFCGELITIADKDWEQLATYFQIPPDMKHIDFAKIRPINAITAKHSRTVPCQTHLFS